MEAVDTEQWVLIYAPGVCDIAPRWGVHSGPLAGAAKAVSVVLLARYVFVGECAGARKRDQRTHMRSKER